MIIDSHVHFQLMGENAYADLRDQLLSVGINKCVLIINRVEEYAALTEHIDQILSDSIIGALGIIVDPHFKNPLYMFQDCRKYGLPTAIKIHPRISGITRADFPELYEIIKDTDVKTIIIDAFIYGPQMECHIGCELAVFLAERFSERNIILAHAGGCDMLKTMLITRPVKNIYYDLSLSCNYLLNTSIEKDMVHGIKMWNNRIMFGTDYPDFYFADSLEASRRLCGMAALKASEEENFFSKNAAMVYGIREGCDGI